MSSLLQHLPSDEQLTAAVAAGDDAAFEELYRRYARSLGAYGARVLRDRSRGEDVAQTALMRAYDALRRGTEPLRVKPWLYKIALNTALELKAKIGEVLDGEYEEVEDTSLDMRGARSDILVGVRDLPERQRQVFVLREIKGLPVGEVARRLELTNQQVEQALFAARNRLAEVLIFGERVDCETIRGLDRSELTHYERRALKSHLRACPSCRRNTGFGLSTLGFWLRDAWAWLIGGGAAAAKVGAVAITATVVGSAPVVAPAVVHKVFHHDAPATSTARAEQTSRLLGRSGVPAPRTSAERPSGPAVVGAEGAPVSADAPVGDPETVSEAIADAAATVGAEAEEVPAPREEEMVPADSPARTPEETPQEPLADANVEDPMDGQPVVDEPVTDPDPTLEESGSDGPQADEPPAEEPVPEPDADPAPTDSVNASPERAEPSP